MRLVVAAIGRLKTGPERELAERYRERASKFGRGVGLHPLDIIEINESSARRAQDRLTQEGNALGALMAGNVVRVALDGEGQPVTSDAFADRLARWRDSGRGAAYFLIGGADGLAGDLKQRADLVLSFGAATWPHQLVRIMLLEQLYRAITVLTGHPYHRG